MAVAFDSVSDRIYCAATYPQTSAGFTLTAWVKINVDRNDYSTIARLSASSSTVATFSTQADGTSGPAYFTASYTAQFTDDLGAVGVWVPVAMARSNNGATARVYRRVGGGDTTTTTSVSASGVTGVPDELCIGARGSADASEWLNGAVAHVRLWSTELTQSEIEAEWASPTPVKSSGLFADWPLATATDLADTVASRTMVVASGGSLTTVESPVLDTPGDVAVGDTSVSGIYVGSTATLGVYVGEQLVWTP